MSNTDNSIIANIKPENITIYNNADLNSLFNFNFTYNFDLLKGIIGALLKNQQALKKEIELANSINNEQDKTIISLRNQIIEIKEKYTSRDDFMNIQEQVNKMNETYKTFDEELAKSK